MKFSLVLSNVFKSESVLTDFENLDSPYLSLMAEQGLIEFCENKIHVLPLGKEFFKHYMFLEEHKFSSLEMATILEIYGEGSQFLHNEEIINSLKQQGMISYRGCKLYVLTGKAKEFAEKVINQIKSFLK